MEFIKYWKKILIIVTFSIGITIFITIIEERTSRQNLLIYSFDQGWSMFQDYNNQYCNNIPSGIMNERYKKARLKFSEITKSKYWISTAEEYEFIVNTNLVSFLKLKVSSLVGLRYLGSEMGGQGTSHNGIDIAMNVGSEIKPFESGKIIKTGIDYFGYGKYIVISQKNGNYVYGHLSKILVKKNRNVNTNDVIGLSGNTGKSTGPHLHYGVIN